MEILQLISKKLQKINIIHIIFTSFSIHMFVISHPNFEVLDEVFFTTFMRWFMLGIDHSPYQLPGLSFIVSPFVYVFGDNWASWRFPIVIFGMVFLYFSNKVIEQVSTKKIAIITSIIMAFSPVIFVSSSLMLRDMPVMAIGFFSIYLYFKQKYYFAALLIGLSALIKETAIFFVMFIVIYHVLNNKEELIIAVKNIPTYRFKFIKTPLIFLLIMAASFLIPLAIYDNTITVLEYSTRYPEYFAVNENFEPGVMRFDILRSTTEIYQKPVEQFNYVSQVTDPIHHLQVIFTKGYYTQQEVATNEFIASFLPIPSGKTVHNITYGYDKTYIDEEGIERHQKEYSTLWVQSIINYTWWHFGFWSCIILMGYTIFQRIKNKIQIPKDITFIFSGFVFFVPYLIIDALRDTFAYYMIYFLPVMGVGLTTIIYKIPNKTIRFLIFAAFLLAIISNFLYIFPMWGF
ncbi:putative membrane protein [Candidatus Nitrosopumilus salaria BD31]|uniref:Membrane protein n=1 Tax=Candidatus Nitrosopumilus salarius BD31 TaxID=859350 RepID=I3D1Q4_9ARCH|nr:glycosyltransferase family 39 protein [Candidatus Nitrosopumilus salaria]EIJ65647.1 putative membrane protein [Candidatus Nitrosopumilus salaria BD31]